MIIISLGIRGLIILLYLIIEFVFIRNQRRSFLLSIIPYIIMLRKVKKELPFGWRVYDKFFHFFHIYVRNKNYCVMVGIKSDLVQSITYDFVHFNWYGKIIKDASPVDGLANLVDFSEKENELYPGLVKSAMRDKKLKELGI